MHCELLQQSIVLGHFSNRFVPHPDSTFFSLVSVRVRGSEVHKYNKLHLGLSSGGLVGPAGASVPDACRVVIHIEASLFPEGLDIGALMGK